MFDPRVSGSHYGRSHHTQYHDGLSALHRQDPPIMGTLHAAVVSIPEMEDGREVMGHQHISR
eukprot:4317398-Prorocentrum_lima.AAC.1